MICLHLPKCVYKISIYAIFSSVLLASFILYLYRHSDIECNCKYDGCGFNSHFCPPHNIQILKFREKAEIGLSLRTVGKILKNSLAI